jgi:lipopolysaccharide transport system ATP-binding protein
VLYNSLPGYKTLIAGVSWHCIAMVIGSIQLSTKHRKSLSYSFDRRLNLEERSVIEIVNAAVRSIWQPRRSWISRNISLSSSNGSSCFKIFCSQGYQLTVKKGEAWGFVGVNGSGKSTLLKLICGILDPYRGSVHVEGRIAPLIELGAGMDPEMTARENIFLNGALMGHSKAYMQEHFEEIVAFAELENFLDVPIKNYSSGMAARLGFSIATMAKPDILIVDEVLALETTHLNKNAICVWKKCLQVERHYYLYPILSKISSICARRQYG